MSITDAGVEPMGGAEGVTAGTAMRPSKRQMARGTALVQLPAGILTLVVAAGSASLFATFWDDAWHTDLGRDQTTIPAHLLLYGSMAVIGAVVAAWGVSALRRGRSVAAVWRQPPLLLAAAGGTVTPAALPTDRGLACRLRPGRRAVELPHVLGVFGSLALIVGFLAGARPDTPWSRRAWVRCCRRRSSARSAAQPGRGRRRRRCPGSKVDHACPMNRTRKDAS
jgi:hypothetical protein